MKNGTPVDAGLASTPALALGVHQQRSEPKRLREAIAEFLSEVEPNWTPKTLLMHGNSLERFIRAAGNLGVAEITRSHCRTFRDSLSAQSDGKPSKPATVNRHLGVISSFFNWSIKEGLRPDNPCSSLRLKRVATSRLDQERSAFTRDELRVLLGVPCGTALLRTASERRKPSLYWVPMIALFSGMRLEEIAQLRTDDIKQVQDFWCFDVNALGDRHLKTAASERLVPLHPQLIALGLLDHLERCRKSNEERLWGDLKANRFGSYSPKLSQWFTAYRRSKGLDREGLSFHSLRHTFIDALKQADVPEARIRQLVGHSESSITLGRYGKRYDVALLAKALEDGCAGICSAFSQVADRE